LRCPSRKVPHRRRGSGSITGQSAVSAMPKSDCFRTYGDARGGRLLPYWARPPAKATDGDGAREPSSGSQPNATRARRLRHAAPCERRSPRYPPSGLRLGNCREEVARRVSDRARRRVREPERANLSAGGLPIRRWSNGDPRPSRRYSDALEHFGARRRHARSLRPVASLRLVLGCLRRRRRLRGIVRGVHDSPGSDSGPSRTPRSPAPRTPPPSARPRPPRRGSGRALGRPPPPR
jgi:hypothetical protein